MKQRLKNQNGTTLVELIVCMVLLAIFTLAAVTLIQPSAQAYMDIQQQTRAQNLADALIETIRGEVLEANGYIRFTDGATDPNNLDSVFLSKGNDYSKGTALEFSVYPNHIELIDKDCVPPLTKTDGTALLTPEQANALNGYLHMRFYRDELNDAGHYGNPQHTKRTRPRTVLRRSNCPTLPTATQRPIPGMPIWGCSSANCISTPAAGRRTATKPRPRALRL